MGRPEQSGEVVDGDVVGFIGEHCVGRRIGCGGWGWWGRYVWVDLGGGGRSSEIEYRGDLVA